MSLSDILLIISASLQLAAYNWNTQRSRVSVPKPETEQTERPHEAQWIPAASVGSRMMRPFLFHEICGRKLPKRKHMETWPHVGLGFWTVNSWYFRVKSWSLQIRLQDCFPSIWTLPVTLPETHKSHRSGVFVDPYQSFNIMFSNTFS